MKPAAAPTAAGSKKRTRNMRRTAPNLAIPEDAASNHDLGFPLRTWEEIYLDQRIRALAYDETSDLAIVDTFEKLEAAIRLEFVAIHRMAVYTPGFDDIPVKERDVLLDFEPIDRVRPARREHELEARRLVMRKLRRRGARVFNANGEASEDEHVKSSSPFEREAGARRRRERSAA